MKQFKNVEFQLENIPTLTITIMNIIQMKQIKFYSFLIVTLTLAACSSTSVWDGMPYQERAGWQSMGVKYYQADQLRRNGFGPEDVRPWYQAGIQSAKKIIEWHRAGFTPTASSKWMAKGIALNDAIKYRKKGLTVE